MVNQKKKKNQQFFGLNVVSQRPGQAHVENKRYKQKINEGHADGPNSDRHLWTNCQKIIKNYYVDLIEKIKEYRLFI